MSKNRSYGGLILVVVILGAAGGGYLYWRAHQDKGPEFYTTKVGQGELVQTVTATGTIKPFQDVLVSSQISGYITSLGVDFNSKVKKGDLLATLLPSNYEAAVQSAEGDLANAKANAKLQQITLGRDKELLGKNLISQADYDSQAALVAEATAQIQIKTATLQTARTNLGYCRIVSPIDGVVITRNVDVGNSVAATLNSPTLFEIGADLTKMQIDAAVSEADVGNVADGQTVNFTVDAYPNHSFTGDVYQIRNAPSTQQNVVIYDVMIVVANPDLKLKPGMTANVSIVVTKKENVVKLPNSALRFRLPETVTVATPAAEPVPVPAAGATPAAGAPKKLTKEQSRAAMRQIFQEAGYTFTPGQPPAPEVVAKIKALAADRGVELPERMLAMLNGGRPAAAGSAEAPITRTVYVLPNDLPGTLPMPIKVRLGISDGTDTEVFGGLKPGDTVIIGMTDQGQSGPSGGARNPFSGRRGGF